MVDKVSPAWSPDGKAIAYAVKSGIWVIRADGNGAHRLNTTKDWPDAPAWSPDSRRIAYSVGFAKRDANIYVMGASGRGARTSSHPAASQGTHPGRPMAGELCSQDMQGFRK
jgi:Tol biopolymer transport system component